MPPRVAIHLVTYHSAATLPACLAGLAAQDEAYELCIVDNASSDATLAVLAAQGIAVQHSNPHNIGYAAAHNQALARTQAPYVLTLNPDVQLQAGFVRALADALDADAGLGMVAGCLLRCEALALPPHSVDSAGLLWRRTWRQALRAEGLPIGQRPLHPAPILGADGAAALYRRAMLTDIAHEGMAFDEAFFMHKEDADVAWRAQVRGWRAAYVPAAIAHHIRSFRPGRRDMALELRRVALFNRYRLLIKHSSARTLRHAPFILAYELAILGRVLLVERDLLPVYAALWRARRALQASRRAARALSHTPAQAERWVGHS